MYHRLLELLALTCRSSRTDCLVSPSIPPFFSIAFHTHCRAAWPDEKLTSYSFMHSFISTYSIIMVVHHNNYYIHWTYDVRNECSTYVHWVCDCCLFTSWISTSTVVGISNGSSSFCFFDRAVVAMRVTSVNFLVISSGYWYKWYGTPVHN